MTSADADRRRQRKGTRGFTLIEVLAALVIVALGMLGAIQAVTQSARNGTYLREKTLAHWIAMNVITEQRLQPSAPDVSETSDEVEFAGERWIWKMTVTQTSVESMRRMDVSVRPADAPEDRSLATVTGFYGEAIAPANAAPLSWTNTQSPGGDGGGDGEGEGDGSGGRNAADDDESPSDGRPPRPPRPPEDPDE
jgi:general secretion pathway protein I